MYMYQLGEMQVLNGSRKSVLFQFEMCGNHTEEHKEKNRKNKVDVKQKCNRKSEAYMLLQV